MRIFWAVHYRHRRTKYSYNTRVCTHHVHHPPRKRNSANLMRGRKILIQNLSPWNLAKRSNILYFFIQLRSGKSTIANEVPKMQIGCSAGNLARQNQHCWHQWCAQELIWDNDDDDDDDDEDDDDDDDDADDMETSRKGSVHQGLITRHSIVGGPCAVPI